MGRELFGKRKPPERVKTSVQQKVKVFDDNGDLLMRKKRK